MHPTRRWPAAIAALGLSFALSSCTDTIAPKRKPGAPTIGTATAGNASASITFTPPADPGTSDITGFGATCVAAGSSQSKTGSDSPITVTGLTNGTDYSCSVVATNSAGSGEPSAGVSVTPFTVPAAPLIGSPIAADGSAQIAFTPQSSNGSPITGYTATCTPTGGSPTTGTGTASPITVSGLTNGTAYSCSVIATNAAGNSSASQTVNVTPATTPGAPTIGAVTPANASLSVAFTAPSSNGGAAITSYAASCRIGTGTPTNATGTSSPITVGNLTNGSTYTCTVTATNSIGASAPSAAVDATPVGPPGAPTIGALTAGNGQISVAFTAPASNGGSAITSYTASCRLGTATPVTNSGSASPIVATGLTNGQPYVCSVTATNAIGTSSSSSGATGTPATVPDAPTIGAATPGDGTLSIAFTAPASTGGAAITSYTASCAAGGTTRTASGSTSPITVNTLTNNTSYTCSVIATNAIGTSAASSTVIGTPGVVPGAPTIGAATAGNAQATIAFTPSASTGSSAITGYTVTCTATGVSVTGTGTSSPVIVTNLSNGTTYSCSVKATNSSGTSAASSTVSVTPSGPVTVPGAPVIGVATAGDETASIAFAAPTNTGGATITSYTATCTVSGGATRTATGSGAPLTVNILGNGVQYSCSVTATNSAGTSSASSTVSVTPTTGTNSTTSTGVSSAASTLGVMCSYSYNQPNAKSTSLTSKVDWTCAAPYRTMKNSTQIPNYPAATTYTGDPNVMTEQTAIIWNLSLAPQWATTATQRGNLVGWAKNGVKFDPATAEVCPGKSYCPSGYTGADTFNVEALKQSLFSAGVDNANAHVQPGGAYHYHGMPTKYMAWIASNFTDTTTTAVTVRHYLIGWAVDGFPIYAKYGYGTAMDASSAVREMKSSYRKLTSGELSTNRNKYSTISIGTFTQDYTYDPASTGGDLDECNGRVAKTPEFPNGIYAYYITEDFPYIMRCLKGTPNSTLPTGSIGVPTRPTIKPPAVRAPRR